MSWNRSGSARVGSAAEASLELGGRVWEKNIVMGIAGCRGAGPNATTWRVGQGSARATASTADASHKSLHVRC